MTAGIPNVYCGGVKKKRLLPVNRNIKRLRELQRITQTEFARRVNEHKSVVCHWEMGRYSPTTTKLPIVARELGVSVDELLRRVA